MALCFGVTAFKAVRAFCETRSPSGAPLAASVRSPGRAFSHRFGSSPVRQASDDRNDLPENNEAAANLLSAELPAGGHSASGRGPGPPERAACEAAPAGAARPGSGFPSWLRASSPWRISATRARLLHLRIASRSAPHEQAKTNIGQHIRIVNNPRYRSALHTASAGLRHRSQISIASALRITGKINSLIACQPK